MVQVLCIKSFILSKGGFHSGVEHSRRVLQLHLSVFPHPLWHHRDPHAPTPTLFALAPSLHRSVQLHVALYFLCSNTNRTSISSVLSSATAPTYYGMFKYLKWKLLVISYSLIRTKTSGSRHLREHSWENTLGYLHFSIFKEILLFLLNSID